MKLANSLETFKETLDNLKVSSNIDFPEGGFEALLQVAACYKKLGKVHVQEHCVVLASATVSNMMSLVCNLFNE